MDHRSVDRLREAKLGGAGSMTLATYGDRFLDARESAGVRDIDNERSRWRNHCATAHFACWPMQNVQKVDAKEWFTRLANQEAADRRKPREIGPQTRKHCLNLMRLAWNAAIEDGHAAINPFASVESPEVPKSPFDYLTLEEQNALARCEKIDEADRLRAMFAWRSGIRQYDQWVMKLTDLRLDQPDPDMVILCHKSGPRKPPKLIRVQLFGVALYAIKRWLQLLPTYCSDNQRGLVWPLPSGAQRQKCKNYGWAEMLEAAGIKRHIIWHELRDTCASSLLMGW